MNITDYTYLINKPHTINERQYQDLEQILESFPYFQSARVLRLKHLYNQDSFRYNAALKVTAAFTSDRSVLFDFITTDQFTTVDNQLYDQKVAELLNMNVIDLEVVAPESQDVAASNSLEESLRNSIQQSGEPTTTPAITPEQKLELGKPLEFNANEKHSFQEWLQLSRLNPIERKDIVSHKELTDSAKDERLKKLDLIDKFIAANPKIPAISKEAAPQTNPIEIEDKSYLMTETLAKVYLEQKKYQRAIQAYEILILKYPEKSSFFADRIEEINKIQQNNN